MSINIFYKKNHSNELQMFLKAVKRLFILSVSAFIFAIGINFFLVPANVYSVGFSGLSQLLMTVFQRFNILISMGTLLILLNIPVLLLGWKKVGKSFTIYSLISVSMMSLFLNIVPIYPLSDDLLLNAVFGGCISAIGIGITLRYGSSTGGMDIIAVVLSKLNGKPTGKYSFILNSVIILTAGYLFGWEKALYSLVVAFTSSQVVDAIHTRYEKLTALIITNKTHELKSEIMNNLHRGVTIVPAKGAFSEKNKEMLMTVVSKYELYELKRLIKRIDPEAFTNIFYTEDIIGRFRTD